MNYSRVKLFLLIINVITFIVFGMSFHDYKERREIMKIGKPIENYKITDYRCNMKGGSVLEIEYKFKKYRVAIAYNYCYDLKKKKIHIDYYYNKNKDEVFTKSGLTKKMVITYGVLFIFFASFWFIPKRYW